MMKSLWDVGEDIKNGSLVSLLDEYYALPKNIQMLFPPGPTQPQRVRVFADYLTEAFKN